MKKIFTGKIQFIKEIAYKTFKIEIISDLNEAHAGQFISVLCDNATLRRPFSIAGFEQKSDDESIITIIFKQKGAGTEYISNLKPNDEINFLAPLGVGFNIKKENSLLIGAGIGIAPMLFLKKELNKQNISNYLISGFKNTNEQIQGSDETIIGGSVLDNIDKIIQEKNINIIYSCGPSIVLKLVSELGNKYSIETQVAMEKIMVCSLGVCRGCIIKLKKDNKIINAAICKDGPVFRGNEIQWE